MVSAGLLSAALVLLDDVLDVSSVLLDVSSVLLEVPSVLLEVPSVLLDAPFVLLDVLSVLLEVLVALFATEAGTFDDSEPFPLHPVRLSTADKTTAIIIFVLIVSLLTVISSRADKAAALLYYIILYYQAHVKVFYNFHKKFPKAKPRPSGRGVLLHCAEVFAVKLFDVFGIVGLAFIFYHNILVTAVKS